MIDTMLAVLAVLTLSSFSAPLVVEAQQAAKLFTVGELHPGTSSEERFAALREAGYVEGQNLSSCAGTQRAASNAFRRSRRSWLA